MFKWLFLLLFLLPLIAKLGFGQESESTTPWKRLKSDVDDAYSGSIHVLSRPIHWQGEDWMKFGSLMAGTVAITLFEEEIRNIIFRNKSKAFNDFSQIVGTYGEPLSVVLLTGVIYAYGNIFNDTWSRETAVIMTATLLPGGIIQSLSKYSAGRARPYLGLGNYYFEPFKMQEDYFSFISGHTLVAMGTSIVLANRIKNPFVKGILYTLGTMAGISRLYEDEHWFSDVILGGALAFGTASSATNWYETIKKPDSRGVEWHLMPYKRGLRFTFTW
jgi:membrane-associated phospholipid phosphatase